MTQTLIQMYASQPNPTPVCNKLHNHKQKTIMNQCPLVMLFLDFLFEASASFFFIDSIFDTRASCTFLLFAHCSAPFFIRIVALTIIATVRKVAFFSLIFLGGNWIPVLFKRARSALLLWRKISSLG